MTIFPLKLNRISSFNFKNVLNFLILIIFFSIPFNGYGQVRCYSFNENSGTYTPLSSTTSIFPSNWNDDANVIPIGFGFKFNGTTFTNCTVNSNGYITFSTSNSASSQDNNYTPLSSNVTTYLGAISALGVNLSNLNDNSPIVSTTEGTAPNRVFTVQWTNARRRNISNDNLNFQIRLYETTNKIAIVYGNCTATSSTTTKVQIGLRGASNADFNNRSLATTNLSWLNNSDRGTTNTDFVNLKNMSMPASGTTFTWTPNSSLMGPASISASEKAVCLGNVTTLTAVGGSAEASTLWFEGDCANITYAQQWQVAPVASNLDQTTAMSVSNGVLSVTSTNSNPADSKILMENVLSTPIDPVVQKFISIRYKVISGTAIQTEIYFKKGVQILDENKVVRGDLISDNKWHILSLNMSTNSNWNNTGGNITGWRFDYTTGANVKMEVDYIILADKPVLENTNDDQTVIQVKPSNLITDYFALTLAESDCLAKSDCSSIKIYRNKTWNGGNGDWNIASNWTPTGVPSVNSCIIIPNGTPTINSNVEGKGRSLNVNGGSLTVKSLGSLSITESINVASTALVTIEDSASLIQDGTTNTNVGNITVKRTAKPMKRYDFTYWSSPVSSQTLYNLSPQTLQDKYYSWNTSIQNWQIQYGGTSTMTPGYGYIVRAPQFFPIATVNPVNFEGIFTGIPNSGDIFINVVGNTTQAKWNLVGNPYPSAIKVDEFLTDPFNNSKINGTIYIWTHNSAPSDLIAGDATYNYTSSDYAAYNGVGGTATTASVSNPLLPMVNPAPNVNVPNGYIASGQSFFVSGKTNGTSTVKFTNSMREKSNNNQFFKSANTNDDTTVEQNPVEIEKNRYWLNIRNDQGAFNQALVGYVTGATNEMDNDFDGELFGGNFVTIYSLASEKQLTIQGRALPFQNSDIVPLGIITTIPGNFTISLDMFDGLFTNQDIFVKDKTLNIIHNLKNGGYAFTTTAGTFENRFEVIYENSNLSVTNPNFEANSVLIHKKDKSIFVNAGTATIDNVQVYDILGKLLFDGKKINASETTTNNLQITNQVVIVRVQTVDGNSISKKILF